MGTRKFIAFALSAAVLLGAVGCSTDRPVEPAATPTPTVPSESTSASPTTPSSEPSTPTAAVVAFNGDCNAALPPASIAQIVAEVLPGAAAQLFVPSESSSHNPVDDIARAAVAAAGVMSCHWEIPGASGVGISILPANIVPDEVKLATSTVKCGIYNGSQWEGGMDCELAVTAGSSWLDVRHPNQTLVERVSADIAARLASQTSAAASFPPDAWAIPNCDVVVAATGAGAGWSNPLEGYPSDAYMPGDMLEAIYADHGSMGFCQAMSDEYSTQGAARVWIYPGLDTGGVAALGMEAYPVNGADQSYTYPREHNGAYVIAVKGSNVIVISSSSSTDELNYAGIASAVIAAMTPRV